MAALVQANITSAGTVDSFLRAAHVARTRNAHQVTAAALYILQHRAYNDYVKEAKNDILTSTEWCEKKRQRNTLNFSTEVLQWN